MKLDDAPQVVVGCLAQQAPLLEPVVRWPGLCPACGLVVIRIGTATVTYYPEGAFTTYEDGSSYAAQPHDSHHYHVIAHRCGYGDDVLAYAREHEVCHHIVSEWIGGHTSKVLWPLAHGRAPDPSDAIAEEALAMTFQRWLRANERPIIGGVDWDGLRARAVALLDT